MATNEASFFQTLIDDVIAESHKLRDDISNYEASHRRERRAYRVMGIFLISAILVCLALLGTARAGLQSTRDTLDYVKSCTTPTGDCYKSSRASTVDFREQLLGVTAIMADCAILGRGDDGKYRKCVKERTGLDASASVAVDPNK